MREKVACHSWQNPGMSLHTVPSCQGLIPKERLFCAFICTCKLPEKHSLKLSFQTEDFCINPTPYVQWLNITLKGYISSLISFKKCQKLCKRDNGREILACICTSSYILFQSLDSVVPRTTSLNFGLSYGCFKNLDPRVFRLKRHFGMIFYFPGWLYTCTCTYNCTYAMQ